MMVTEEWVWKQTQKVATQYLRLLVETMKPSMDTDQTGE